MKNFNLFFLLLFFLVITNTNAQFIDVGSGSYTTQFPGVDQAGRNALPAGTPNVTGIAATKPVPSSDWWTPFLAQDFGTYVYNYPMSIRALTNGLVLSYTSPNDGPDQMREPMSDVNTIIVGVSGLSASKASVADYGDWTVDLEWIDASHNFSATIGMAMPFAYFTKGSSDVASVEITRGTVTISNEMLIVSDSYNGSSWAVYGPSGTSWTENGGVYTSTLAGKTYWSVAMLPQGGDAFAAANALKTYAYAFPTNTTTNWSYNQSTGVVKTDFTTSVDVKEGGNNVVYQGILPHQWANWGTSSPTFGTYSYSSVRGELKTIASNTFSVENTFYGVLPILPGTSQYSATFDPAALSAKIDAIQNRGLATWTDSYNQGIEMYMLVQGARIAEQIGDTEAVNQMVATIKERLEDWMTAESGEVAFLFMYDQNWDALIGYPAGHYQDQYLNDRHFHWGYFIGAAALVEQYIPGWSNNWGEMVNMLVRDAASTDRNDNMFPFLRNFNTFAGHSWAAGGIDGAPMGNNQESSSEAMNFATSLINWGSVTGNQEIVDLGVYIYTTELTAINEYWFDMHDRNFGPTYDYTMTSRVWGAGYDRYTFWTQELAATYGIEIFPLHGGSMYLAQNETYVNDVWAEMMAKTDLATNTPNDNLWYDTYWMYRSMVDPDDAVSLYEAYTERNLKFGHTDAHTYHWLHSMAGMGKVDPTVTANHPLASVFNDNGTKTYVAHNYSASQIVVNFSDGYSLTVPAQSTATNKDASVLAVVTASATEVPVNGSVTVSAEVTGSASKVEFYDGSTLVATDYSIPYSTTVNNMSAKVHGLYVKVYEGDNCALSNVVSVIVGAQTAYNNNTHSIPGTINAAHYDQYEGGLGQGICYNDATTFNEAGTFRTNEYVDAGTDSKEGYSVGWINAGEWMEYTVNVATAGYHDVNVRFASGNGGGSFIFKVNGIQTGPTTSVNSTGGWDTWQGVTVQDVNLPAGETVIQLYFIEGGLNVSSMNFTYDRSAGNTAPTASAGNDQTLMAPTNITLDGSNSYDFEGDNLTYLWTKVSGPACTITNNNQEIATVNDAAVGTYIFELTVDDGQYSHSDQVTVVVNEYVNLAPVANAGADQAINIAIVSDCVTLDAGSSFDSNGDVVSYSWAVTGPSNPNVDPVVNPTVCGLIEGTYTFTLTVSDGELTDNDIVVVTVTNVPDQTPTADAGLDLNVETGCTTISGTASDPENSIVSTIWTQTGGPSTATLSNENTLDLTACDLLEGVYTFRLTVTDAANLVATDDVLVTVTAPDYCTGGPANGDYTYKVTSDGDITFVPGYAGVGDNIVILYLGGAGYIVQPNVPYVSGITSGIINFYYTYSIPEGTEKNTADDPHSVDVGTCGSVSSDTEAPTVPTGLASSNITETSLTLTWNASSDNVGVASYNVYQDGALTMNVSGTNTSVTGLSASTSYDFTVSAIDAAGNESAQSSVLTASTSDASDTQSPSVPAGLSANNVTETTLTLSWNASTDNIGVASYDVYQDGVLITNVSGTSTSITGLSADTSYDFTVIAKDAAGNESAQSSILTVTTLSGTSLNLYVQSITDGTQDAGRGFKNAVATVVIYDNLGNPVSGATVTGTFSGTIIETVSGITGADGSITLITTSKAKGKLKVDLCVDDVIHSSLAYDANSNNLTCTNDTQKNALGIEEEAITSINFKLYPNPVNDRVNIEVHGTFDKAGIYIFDLQGKLMFSKETISSKNVLVDMSKYTSGTYLIKVISNDKITTKKVIKN